MIRILKRTSFAFVLVAVFLFNCNVSLAAGNTEIKSQSDQEISTKFKELCNSFFVTPKNYKVIDNSGNDICEEFYSANKSFYESSNYSSIQEYMYANVDYFCKENIQEVNSSKSGLPVLRGAIKTKSYSDWFYKAVDSSKYCPDFEMQYTISGTFNYNNNTGKITSYSGPDFDLSYCSLRGVWSYAAEKVSTKATIASNAYSIKASCSFKLKTTCSVPVGEISVPGFSETFGPFTGSMTYSPE